MGLRNRHLFKDKCCFFITTTCYQWLHLFNTDTRKIIIADSLQFIADKYKAAILGYVIMPNHIHIILWFKEDNKLSDTMRDFKKFTSTAIRKDLEKENEEYLLNKIRVNNKQIFKVWEDRFDDVWLEDIALLETKLDYIHCNPLQSHWNLVNVPEDYKFSSAGFYSGIPEISKLQLEDYRDYF